VATAARTMIKPTAQTLVRRAGVCTFGTMTRPLSIFSYNCRNIFLARDILLFHGSHAHTRIMKSHRESHRLGMLV
jgi:hypothetical protein